MFGGNGAEARETDPAALGGYAPANPAPSGIGDAQIPGSGGRVPRVQENGGASRRSTGTATTTTTFATIMPLAVISTSLPYFSRA